LLFVKHGGMIEIPQGRLEINHQCWSRGDNGQIAYYRSKQSSLVTTVEPAPQVAWLRGSCFKESCPYVKRGLGRLPRKEKTKRKG
jgi:hypothetical protein